MGFRTLKLNVGYATDLENVRRILQMKVYAAVSISGRPETEQNTPVDENGGISPTWNKPMQFTINTSSPQEELVFKLKCKRSVKFDKGIGEVRVSIGDLLSAIGSDDVSSVKDLARAVMTPSGVAKGELAFSYSFCEVSNNPGRPLPPLERRRGPRILERVAADTAVTVGSTIATTFAVAAFTNGVANDEGDADGGVNDDDDGDDGGDDGDDDDA